MTPKHTYSLTTRVFIVKHKMELTLKSGQHLQPFLPTIPPGEDTETDAVKFSLIFIPYAGSQERTTARFPPPMNMSSGGMLCPTLPPFQQSY